MSSSVGDIDGLIGTRIRDMRAAAGLTLEALARRAAVSRAMLSRVERGESSPTAQLLVKICGGLGVTLAHLFAAPGRPPSPLARRADQPVWRDPASGYLRRAVSPPGTGSPVEIVDVEFPGGSGVTLDAPGPPGADQHVWVIEGTLELSLGDELFRLEPGDCLRMGFDRPIHFRNPGTRPVRYAVVVSRKGPSP